MEFMRSEGQLGDILMKPLGRVKFLKFRTKIYLINVCGYNKAWEEIVIIFFIILVYL
jgi:hypothetical protein